jgi:hypothetical protein
MYYRIQDEIERINVKQINKDVMTFGLITFAELEKHYEQFGFSKRPETMPGMGLRIQ